MWKFVGDKLGLEPIPGLPLEATDGEFEAAVKEYEATFGPEAKGSVKMSGLYEQVKESAKPALEA